MNIKREIRRKEHLLEKIQGSSKSSETLELIIGTQHGKQHEVAERFRKLGIITQVYDLVPFFSIQLEPDQAELLFKHLYYNSAEMAELTISLQSVLSIDAVSQFSKVPSKKQQNMDVYHTVSFDTLWNLRNIGVYDARAISTGVGVKIAIVDTGVDYNHSQLRSSFGNIKGYDFVRNNFDPMDREGHGTHVAGTACSIDCGVSLDSELFAVRVLDSNGSGYESNVIAGVEWCIKNKIDVVNMSLGSRNASRAFEEICKIAYNQGTMLIAAAGNESHGPSYPASFDESVVAVTAVDKDNDHASFSNIFETNDISAPGVSILSSYIGGGFKLFSGTSMATPHVTGTFALALALFNQDPKNLEDFMDDTAQHLETDERYENSWVYGAGLIRCDKLLNKIINDSKFRAVFRKRYVK